jgi:hypothetical protein
MGPPSKAGTWGTAAATYVPTSPNIRIDILTARFMGSLLNRDRCSQIGSLDAEPHYKAHVKRVCKNFQPGSSNRPPGVRLRAFAVAVRIL